MMTQKEFIWKYLKPHFSRFFIVIIALMLVTASILALGQAIKASIDLGLSGDSFYELFKIFLFILGLISLLAFGSFTRSFNINILCERIEREVKVDLFRHLFSLSPEFYETNRTSDVISTLTNDLAIINSSVATSFSFLLRNSIMLIGGVIFLLITNLKLSLIVLMLIPLAVMPIILLGRKIKIISKLNQQKISEVTSIVEESLNAIKTIIAFSKEDYILHKLEKNFDEVYSLARTRVLFRATMAALVIFIVLNSLNFVVWIGGRDVISGELSSGQLVSFLYYSVIVAFSFGSISEVVSDIQRAKASIDRVFGLFLQVSTIKDEGKNETPNDIKIEFKNVSFSYPSRSTHKALENVSFTAMPGEKLAIIGHSGAGKTTIFNLLLRFYQMQEGDIQVGGVSINDIQIKKLRELIAIVPQEPVIFSASALENISFARPDATMNEIIDAAKKAEIYDFISSLPDKFDTYLGEKGIRISGGQKQRIAIARAILKDAKILLLDEATNSLDSENERLVQKAIDNIGDSITTITIAHRASTIEKADRVIELSGGKIKKDEQKKG